MSDAFCMMAADCDIEETLDQRTTSHEDNVKDKFAKNLATQINQKIAKKICEFVQTLPHAS